MAKSSFSDRSQSGNSKAGEKGAITVVESLIAIAIGLAVIVTVAQTKVSQMEYDRAVDAGHAVAAYTRAASAWIANSPPASSGSFSINNLQDCADVDGARHLPCVYDADTPIPYAFDTGGNPIDFGDLRIDVTVSSSGTSGVIDFGTFRAGSDENSDSLPDSRPDLAGKVLQTASKQSAAGVLGFFILEFFEQAPTGIILDRSDPGFDQARVDNLSRIRARIGSTADDVPFLRVDGGNEMTGSLVFDNGMQITKNTNSLSIEGPGDVEIQTTTGNLVVAGEIQTASLDADSAEFAALSVAPSDGVSGDGFDRFDQAPDISRIDSDMLGLAQRLSSTESDTQTNRSNIALNSTEISRLTGTVNRNTTDIAAISADLNEADRKINQNINDISTLSDSLSKLPSESACAPSKIAVISDMSSKGYKYHYDTNALTGSAGCFGTTCYGTDRCGDTVRGTMRVSSAWAGNPEKYSARDSTLLSCSDYNINFYRTCSCHVPRAPSCK